MASTVLPNGIIIPEKYSRDWYADLYHNWQELDNLLGGGTPKDGTLTIQKNGSTVGTFSANQSTNETINITVPDVNDATLTIQQNGTTVDTFTANSSTDKTVNISVPTKTSDLTNDSNFVPSSDLATVATSGSYNDLSNKPTIPTVNNATLTIQKNGTNVQTFTANQSTNATANITVPTKTSDLTNDSGFITSDSTKIPLAGSNQISGSLIPSTDGTVNLGSPSYQWNNAYIKSLTINGVACGDILTHNASEFVDLISNQTIGGNKTFSNNLTISRSSPRLQTKSTTYSSETSSATTIADIAFLKNDGGFSAWIVHQLRDDLSKRLCFRVYPHTSSTYRGFVFDDGCNLYPENSNSALGTSTSKWKTINGINPGALSLPSISNTGANAWIALDTTDWVKNAATSAAQKYTPPADGWLNIRVNNATMLGLAITGGGNYMHQMVRSETPNGLALLIPVFKNTEVAILVAGGENLVYDRSTFYYCQGNV